MRYCRLLFAIVALVFCTQQAAAFEINGSKWPGAQALLYVDIAGTSGTGFTFNSAFTSAISEWNTKTPFTFSLVQQNRNPCLNDGLNGVDFAANLCGSAFGNQTLAVTVRRFQSAILGPPKISQADIIINQAETFNVYDGNLIQFGIVGLDLKRIAVHELGHALGLEHSQSAQSIMAPNIGNLFTLQNDDIKGVETLYGGLANCAIKKFGFGVINGALDANDCTVDDLTVGGSDSSPIDVYQFSISNTTSFSFAMTSPSLDSVLLVADTDLNIIAFDNKSSNQCSSTLNTTLQPGTYYLLANTYDEVVKEACGITGEYQITTSFSSNAFLGFTETGSLSGGPSFGVFSAGISANNGLSYGNRFKSTDSLDIHASINIDPSHQGQPGFLVVAALFDGNIHLLNAAGEFVVFGSKPGNIDKVSAKILAATEAINIVSDLVPADLGISSIVVDFAVGYGLDSNPAEVYFHSTPLNLTVSP